MAQGEGTPADLRRLPKFRDGDKNPEDQGDWSSSGKE
jgi:hypothetical protein